MHGTRPRPARWRGPLVVVGWLVTTLACTGLFDAAPDPQALAAARQLVDEGRLPEARSSYEALAAEHPNAADVAVGQAYLSLLAGRLQEADEALARVDFGSGEVTLRRALIAQRQDELDKARDFGLASGLPTGQLLAAEVDIIDLELEQAIQTLQGVAAGEGTEATTARAYLGLLQHDDPLYQSLANPIALWALGKRQDACEGAERFLSTMPATPERDEDLLLWAGRAVTSGMPRLARSMLDQVVDLPNAQRWRLHATRAMIDVAEGQPKQALATFAQLGRDPDVPVDGLEDARVTACFLALDEATATALLGDLNTPGAAHCLLQAGRPDAARIRSTGPALGHLLENL